MCRKKKKNQQAAISQDVTREVIHSEDLKTFVKGGMLPTYVETVVYKEVPVDVYKDEGSFTYTIRYSCRGTEVEECVGRTHVNYIDYIKWVVDKQF